MKCSVMVKVKVNNLPEDWQPSGKYLVVRISEGALWYYGTYKEKHRADYAAMECGNAIVVELSKSALIYERELI